ncbi:MAG: NAD(P)-dependent alcohol dehydrogenase [Phycisphaerae bacterium]|nr:NAD(P)-dependent alcohol dehydrogenase [Phycisphaerae bacterium]
MKSWQFAAFGIENLKLVERPAPTPRPGHVVVDVRAFSLNYRDLLMVTGRYNPKLALPATPISDAAAVVSAVGEGVTRWKVGDHVISHFAADWINGPFRSEYTKTSLGCPGPGLAAEQVELPAHALVPMSAATGDWHEAATLPIAALTAWSSLFQVGALAPGQTVLTLGTGGVSIFAVQFARATGARVIITSSSDAKLERAKALGADEGVNYRSTPKWDDAVLALTDGRGADVVVENGGAGTLNQSMRATKPAGRVAILGALTGLQAEINTGLILMKRLTLGGVYVDCRDEFERMNRFIGQHSIRPVIDRVFPFEEFPEALRTMARGDHFGKIVVSRTS